MPSRCFSSRQFQHGIASLWHQHSQSSIDLNRITKSSSSTMHLKEAHFISSQCSILESLLDQILLCWTIGSSEGTALTILINCSTKNQHHVSIYTLNLVRLTDTVNTLKSQGRHCLCSHIPISNFIQSLTPPIRCQHTSCMIHSSSSRTQHEIDTASKSSTALLTQ